ncbi:Integrator complex subunit 3 [Mortierella sp. AD011]|nr:Integrator complex subunit 3 [Mortierella sp. AD010]KAF9399053.1 Integrator complex subunit 3 [Mortierella sp. AD011]
MAVPEPPMSLIFDNARFDEDDPNDLASLITPNRLKMGYHLVSEMKAAYDMLMVSIQGMTEIEIHNQIQATASISMIKHSEIINGLLYGILTYNTNPNNANSNNSNSTGGQSNPTPSDLFRHMNFVARDSLAYAVKQTRYFCTLVNFHRIRPQVREQLLWLVGQLTEIRVHGVEHLYTALLKQIRGGDVSQANIQHAEAMLRLLQTHLHSWVYSIPSLIAQSCFTYLRIMLDHGRFGALRQQEATFCAKLLRERFRDCSDVGRDLVRALQDVARVKEIEDIWVDLLYAPEKLNPQLEGVHQLMAMPSKDVYLASRLTYDMEHKLLYILKYINVGQHHRNLQWFIDRYLSAPETDALFCDVIRYICGVYHPTNAVLASSIVPRYVIIGGLIRFIKTNVAAANVKLALFYDWLFYDPSKDSIMNIEFLHFTIENYHPPLREYIHKHVGMAAQAIVEKGVIRSFRFIYKSPSLDEYPPVREYMVAMFPAQLGDIAENAAGFTIGAGAPMESTDEHNPPARLAGNSESNEGVDEFESSPPHSGYVAQIAGQDGEEEDDDQDRKEYKTTGRKSRPHSRESSREPMAVDEPTPTLKDGNNDSKEDEVMESSVVEQQSQQQPKRHDPSVLSDWTFTDDDATAKGSSKEGESGLSVATPIPGASLWIFGTSLQEFKKAYEIDPEAPGTAKMFRNIWEVYGDVAGAGVEGSDIAQEIGKEICAFAKKAEVPESYVMPASLSQGEDAGAMEALMSCLWKVTERDGKDGALRVAQMFLKSEITVDPSSRLLGMWYLLGLVRGQNRRPTTAGITREQALQLYGSYIRASVKQDQADKIEEDGPEAPNDPSQLGREYLLRDLQQLQDRQAVVFESVLPMVLQYLPELIPRTEIFLQLTLSMATPAQIYRLSMGLIRRDFWLLSTPVPLPTLREDDEEEGTRKVKSARNSKKKNATQDKSEADDAQSLSDGWEPKVTSQTLKVLSKTLGWETYDQLGVWQLIMSEVGGVSDAVTTILTASWIPSMSTQSHAEALGGLLNLVRTLTLSPPEVKLGRAIVRIASQTDIISAEMRRFCEANFAQWARRYPDQMAAILLSLSDKNATPVESIAAPSDGDVEMEDTTLKHGANKGGSKNTRAKNSATATKAKLTPKQRKEQAIQLRAALSLIQAWWEANGLSTPSPSPTAKQLFSRIWSQVKTQVQEALAETFGLNEKNSWPKDWWLKDEDESKSRWKGRRDTRSDDDGEERSQDDDEVNGDDHSDDDDDDRRKKSDVDQDDDNDKEQSSDDEDRRNKDRKRFGGAAGSAGSSRRNSPKVNSATFNSSSRKSSTTGSASSAVAGLLNSRSRGKNSPAPSPTKKMPAKKGATTRKRKISDDDDEEEEEEEQDEEEEEEAEDMEEEEEEEEEEDEEKEEEEKESKSKKGKSKQPAKKATKTIATKTRSSTRNKAKPITRNGRKKLKDEDEDDEDDEDENEDENEDEEDDKNEEEDEQNEGEEENEDEEEEEEEEEQEEEEGDDEEDADNGKQTMYVSQRRAAASANSKLMSKPSPSSSTSPTSIGAKSKAAAAKRRGKLKRQIIPEEDESDE